MYILDKLRILTQTQTNADMQIAQYFLKNIHRLQHLTVNQCIEECHVSRASFHRFYNKAGFTDFKDLVQELNNEYSRKVQSISIPFEYANPYIHSNKIMKFTEDIKKARRVFFYGSYTNIMMLEKTLLVLQQEYHVEVDILLYWDKKYQEQLFDSLNENDVFVIVDANYNLPILIEKSINQSDMLNLMDIDSLSCIKYYIGIPSNMYYSFHNIEIQDTSNEFLNDIQILSLDYKLYQQLKG